MSTWESIEDLDAALAKVYGANAPTLAAEAKARRAREKKIVSSSDGRRAKFTGRTVQFNVKMKPDLKKRIVQASRAQNIKMAPLVEHIFEAYLASLGAKGANRA